jgi:hypothetical protein
MRPNDSERRRAVRRIPQPEEALSRVRLRLGRELTVVNISSSGVFLEGFTRLLPNTHTDIHIVTRNGRVLVRGRVVRALVWRLERDVVCYRTALAFDTVVDTEPPGVSESKGRELSERSSQEGGLALSERLSGRGPDERESNGYAVPAENPGNIEATGNHYPQSGVQNRA